MEETTTALETTVKSAYGPIIKETVVKNVVGALVFVAVTETAGYLLNKAKARHQAKAEAAV